MEYLFGVLSIAANGTPAYRDFWAFNPEEEKAAFQAFLGWVAEQRAQYPDLHIYHYEPSALKRLMGRYAVGEDEVDDLLRQHVFVDLHQVVKESVIAAVERYGLKELEVFHDFGRAVPLPVAGEQRAQLERAIEMNAVDSIDDALRDTVQGYNYEDCASTLSLRDWLE